MVRVSLQLLLVVAISIVQLTAQSLTWTSPGTTWTYSGFGRTPVNYPHELYVDRDTLIDSLPAVVVRQRGGQAYRGYAFEAFDTIILREEEERLYQYLDGDFRLLYDFGLEVGDTLRAYVPEALRNRDQNQEYALFRVDSISRLSPDEGRQLRGQYLSWINPYHDVDGSLAEGWRYELLGSVDGYLLPYGYFFCDGQCPRFLRCFSSGPGADGASSAVTFSAVDFACDSIISSTRELNISASFKLYPNPLLAGRDLLLEWNGRTVLQQNLHVQLYDPLGRALRTVFFSSGNSLRVSLADDLPTGIYTLVLRTPEGRAVKRILISGG